MNGKQKCKVLKEIRRQIAAENDISYVTAECRHKGDCLGTCPRCEAEVRYLEEQLRLRQRSGKAVAVAGIAAAIMVTASGCDLADILHPVTGGAPLPPSSSYEEQVDGQMIAPTDSSGIPTKMESTEPLMGDLLPPPEETVPTDMPLMGEPTWPAE